MTIELPRLPYELDALSPYISKETLEYHYGKHHQTYVTNLNNLIAGTEYENMSLEEIIIKSETGPIFNNAAQVWNHTFYFESLGEVDNTLPTGQISEMINKNFGSFENFKIKFTEMALKNFGSGWTWLSINSNGSLEIVNTSNAENPFKTTSKPLLTIDIWEHAYYIDYRNARAKYIENFWNIVDWDMIESRL
ncbi:MAG: Fe-Mn family superoxide dismutase [Candidatus Gracilibacteria bacterium]|nr:Fe-Mn family superoxide dismutase [Candidatus Gracilibacteria bacterium]